MTFFDFIDDGFIGYYLTKGAPETTFMILYVGGFIAAMIAGYLLGSLNSAIIISRIKYGKDIRSSGSGNAGMTNVLRTYGKGSAGLTLLGDFAKTVVAYFVGTALLGIPGAYFSCFMCVVGHIFPVFYKFRGGKGIVCAGTMILLLNPFAFLIILAVFIILFIGFRYVSLASIMAAMMYPIAHRWTIGTGFMIGRFWMPSMAFAVLTAVLVLWRHYPNMKRLLNRTESKIDLKKIFGKKSKDAANDGEAAATKAPAAADNKPAASETPDGGDKNDDGEAKK